MNNEELEQVLQDKGLNAPRVTLGMINDVVSKSFVTFTVLPNTTTTICQIILPNKFTLLGTSACISKDNFNVEVGQRIALDDAKSKLWELMGYAMMDDAYNEKLREEALTPE